MYCPACRIFSWRSSSSTNRDIKLSRKTLDSLLPRDSSPITLSPYLSGSMTNTTWTKTGVDVRRLVSYSPCSLTSYYPSCITLAVQEELGMQTLSPLNVRVTGISFVRNQLQTDAEGYVITFAGIGGKRDVIRGETRRCGDRFHKTSVERTETRRTRKETHALIRTRTQCPPTGG